MDILRNYNLKDLSHDLIIDGSSSYYKKIPNECEFPIIVDYPYPIGVPARDIDNSIITKFFKYTCGDKETQYAKREYKRMKADICNQDFKDFAVLPEFLINYIQNEVAKETNYGFNISYCHGILEKFYIDGELYLITPDKHNNIEITSTERPREKIVSQWSYPDPIRSIKSIYLNHSNGFSFRGQNNLYIIDIGEDLKINTHLKLKCDSGYYDDTLNHFNGNELALMDANTKLKLFDMQKQQIFSFYDMKEVYGASSPRLLKMNFLTENMMMIMTDKNIHVLDIRCKDIAQGKDIKLHNCDILLDFTVDKNKDQISNEVYISSRHAFFIYDIRSAFVNDYIHHNLRFPPCYIKYFKRKEMNVVALFGQSSSEAAVFGTSSPYSLPYHINTLDETVDRCKSRKSLPVIPNLEKRLDYPITGVQMVASDNEEDISIYFSNIFGEIFRQDVLQKSYRSEEPFEKMHDWLMEIYEKDDPELNIVHMANARAAFESDIEFNDVDLFNHYEKSNVHEFLENEEFDFRNWNVENFEQIWEDDEQMNDFSLYEMKPEDTKVEEWIMTNNFQSPVLE